MLKRISPTLRPSIVLPEIADVDGLDAALAFTTGHDLGSIKLGLPHLGGLTADYGHQITVPMPGYIFTISSGNATAGAVYSNNGETFTVLLTIAAQTTVKTFGTGAPEANGTLTKVSGTGDATLTFSAVTNPQESTHPSIIKFEEPWNGYPYWGAFCYYPAGDNTQELPCVLCSLDGETWVVPPGGSNPIDYTGGTTGYSDNVLKADVDGSINLLYRKNLTSEFWYAKKSFDGITWSDKVNFFTTAVNSAASISPVYWRAAGHRGAVDVSGAQATYIVDHYVSSGGLTGTYTLVNHTNVTHALGIDPWHMEVFAVGDELGMYLNAKANTLPAGNYLLKSTDGDTWTIGLAPNHLSGTAAFEVGGLYKGCPVLVNAPGNPYIDLFYGSLAAAGAAWWEGRTRIYLNPLSKSLHGIVSAGIWKTTPHASYSSVQSEAQKQYAVPFLVDRKVTIDEICVSVATGQAGANAIVGFYSDINGRPDTLLCTSTPLDASATAIVTQSVSWTLDPGFYWLVILTYASGTRAHFTFCSGLVPMGYLTAAGVYAAVGGCWKNSFGQDTLVGRWTTTWTVADSAPLVGVHIATVR